MIKTMSDRKIKKTKIILFGILLLAFFLRGYKLGSLPSFHTDEVDFVYNAYSLLKTGRDQTGAFLPLGTTSTGDLRPAFYVYLTLLPVKILGLTELAARIPSLFFGTATVWLLYLFAKDFFKNDKTALLSSGLLAVSFWHITLTREASEKTVALFFVLGGIWLVLKYFSKKNLNFLFLTFVLFFLSIHTYHSPRFFLLMFLPIMWFVFKDKLTKKQSRYFLSFTAVFMLIIFFFTFFYGKSAERLNQLLIFNSPQTQALLGEQIREEGSQGNIYWTRFFHNKPINYSFTLLRNYLTYFTSSFLFLDGGEPARINVPATGLLNIVEAPFLVAGVFFVLVEIVVKKKKQFLLLVLWWFLAVLPAAFTYDEIPSVYRTLTTLPAIEMIIAYGMIKVVAVIPKGRIMAILGIGAGLFYAWFFLFFLHQYFVHFEIHQLWYRNYAQKQLALFLKKEMKNYDEVLITNNYGGTEQILRFYLKYDPVELAKNGFPRDREYGGFANFIFVPDHCPSIEKSNVGLSAPGEMTEKLLFINHGECKHPNPQAELAVIKWQDGVPAYRVVEGSGQTVLSLSE